ncbi:hypothetical protein MES5069_230019 [Mesorhizobium escarrei]|uniref:Transposase n=1 Tax=Mesorhizobium escarrei TaxID=666018 RepID=A0ABN8JPK0_9HYPH|nr:hypothetical protein MES5069_230019 [Mesorhizobium escarrei]
MIWECARRLSAENVFLRMSSYQNWPHAEPQGKEKPLAQLPEETFASLDIVNPPHRGPALIDVH